MSRFNNGKGYVSRRKVMWANSPLRRATLDLSSPGKEEVETRCFRCLERLPETARCDTCGQDTEA